MVIGKVFVGDVHINTCIFDIIEFAFINVLNM